MPAGSGWSSNELQNAALFKRSSGRHIMNLQKIGRTIGFNWIDKAGLILAVAVLTLFLGGWLMLLLAAGSAPTERLTFLCLAWTIRAETWAVLPVWLGAKLISFIAIYSVHAIRMRKLPISSAASRKQFHRHPLSAR
jgi:hypothetical protein